MTPRGNRRRRPSLFEPFWTDPETGRRCGAVRKDELREAYRLWREHADVRTGKFRIRA